MSQLILHNAPFLANNYDDLKSLGFLLVTTILCGYLVYQWALPKPIPGIPHNKASARRLLGDIPDLIETTSSSDLTLLNWMHNRVAAHNSPIIQVFLRPFGKPFVVVADFREAQDVNMRRKEFDRSPIMHEFFKGIIPNHHIHEQTNAVWKAHRRLLQDLMSPPFLNKVAAPAIYTDASNLIRLWELKASIADGRPFEITKDVHEAVLDAVLGFAFGPSLKARATLPNAELLGGLSTEEIQKVRGEDHLTSGDAQISFPKASPDDLIRTLLDSTDSLADIHGSPVPQLRWHLVTKWKPRFRRALRMKNRILAQELQKAVERMGSAHSGARSAVEHMIERERKLAENDGRAPEYVSPVMVDETFGFIVAGHDTSSTEISWAFKILADHPKPQTRLRSKLQAAYTKAVKENRSPSIAEITGLQIPYLDAIIEELLRYSGTVPMVDRQAINDTEILGFPVPKGTTVTFLSMGPSMMSPGFEVDESKRSESSQNAMRDGKGRAWDPNDIGLFKPERWLVPTPSGNKKGGDESWQFDATAGPQLAFGLGTRSCYGKRLAYVELRVLLTLVIWNFVLLPCPKKLSGYAAVAGITHRPTQCFVRLRKVELK
ncbi:uncharacterized protein JN550_005407 [Neoarthrinium moseri]|uniref:uncharacterized protein n=1 Tax=Neoarthrinium moseri TaxID=1658444 RepID=UPI001FDB132D|nr:uncharacterized protein JN550_005407 [Neoarthrinium moseri]KAI1869817.1 hypothetical protein JN550_005407 [Neoarthrinium moseri]